MNEKTTIMTDSDPGDILSEHDFTQMNGVVRGKYASKAKNCLRMIRIADDLSDSFPDDEVVNAALRDCLKGHTV